MPGHCLHYTESLLIVTPKDGHTSTAISKIDDELSCLEYPNTTDDCDANQNIQAITTLLQIPVCVYTPTVNFLLKDLHRSLFGKLLMFYNLFITCRNINAIALLLMHYRIILNKICHIATITLMLTLSGGENSLQQTYYIIRLTSCIAVTT